MTKVTAGLVAIGALLVALAAHAMLGRDPEPPPPLRVLLIDASASTHRASPNAASRLRRLLEEEATQAELAAEEVLVVVAGEEVGRAFGPGPAAELRAELRGTSGQPFDPLLGDGGRRSRLARGAELVERVLDERVGAPASLLVVGDGTHTGPSPTPVLQRLVASGVTWRGRLELEPELGDAGLSDLELPERLEVGAPLVGSVRVHLRPGRDASAWEPSVELRATNGAGERTIVLPVPEAGSVRGEPFALDLPFELGPLAPGRTDVVVRARTATRDPVPENDVLAASVLSGDALDVGVLVEPALLAPLEAGLSALAPGVVARVLEPEGVADRLPGLDALLVADRSLEDLPEELVASFVRSGGGLLVLGGWNLLDGWSADAAPDRLAALLPLVPDEGGLEPRRVWLVVDGSGSMEGEPFELVRRAAVELVRATPPRDEVALSFFTTVLSPARVLREGGRAGDLAERERAARRLLDERVPGGPTLILDSLEALVRERTATEDRALVLLLSDGREGSEVLRPEERARAVRAGFAATRTELVVFAVGAEADRGYLSMLVDSDQALRDATDLADLGSMFRREVNRERVRSDESIELLAGADELARALLPGDRALAPLRRVIRLVARPSATVLAATAAGEPALAVQRVGRGRVALMGSVPFGDWAPAWRGRFTDLGPLLRWCARRDEPTVRPRAKLVGGELVVQGLAPETPPLVRALRLVDGAPVGEAVELGPFVAPSGIARTGERRAELLPSWRAADEAAARVRLETLDGLRLGELPLPAPADPELADPRPRFASPESGGAPSGVAPGLAVPSETDGDRRTALVLLGLGSTLLLVAAWRLARGDRSRESTTGRSRSGGTRPIEPERPPTGGPESRRRSSPSSSP